MSAYLDPKPCTECGRVLPRSEFHSNGPGVAGRCKECVSQRKRDQYARDPSRYVARVRQWKERNPERAAQSERERKARWVQKNREHLRAYQQAYGRERRARQRAQRQQSQGGEPGVDNGVP